LVVAFPRLLRPVQTEPAGEGSALWRRTLRFAISIIVLPALSMAIIFTLVRVIAQSEQWDLPGGRLLDTILSSCQFEHSSRAGVDVEHMICPTRLGASEFPQVLKDAVVASEDERFYSHGATTRPRCAPPGIFLSETGKGAAPSPSSSPAPSCSRRRTASSAS
jgi:membrane peptidoglycan carboxypeptidase